MNLRKGFRRLVAGKSTVAKLLLRFHDPDTGIVRLDGHDLSDLTLYSLRENVAVLLQETLVFDGTVHARGSPGQANLFMGSPGRDCRRRQQPGLHAGTVPLSSGTSVVKLYPGPIT